MDRLQTKREMEATKTELEQRIDTLKTKDGADAFIANELEMIDAALPKLRDRKLPPNQISMREFLSRLREGYLDNPEKVIEQAINRTERQIAEINYQLKLEVADDTVEREAR